MGLPAFPAWKVAGAIALGALVSLAGHAAELAVGPGWSALRPPYLLSHRGSPAMFMEHSLHGYRRTVAMGSPFVEVDCHLLADGSVGVMHDETLERTTTTTGLTAAQTEASWRELRFKAPAGVGMDPAEVGPPLLRDVLEMFANRAIILVEPKNRGAGAAIVRLLKEYKVSPDHVLVNSFDELELEPAIAEGFPVALSIFHEKTDAELAVLATRPYKFVTLWHGRSDEYVARVRAAGITLGFYTISRYDEMDRALKRGAIGFYTDDPFYLDRAVPRLGKDGFSQASLPQGILPMSGRYRGRVTAPGKWGVDATGTHNQVTGTNNYAAALQGWCSPLHNATPYKELTIRFSLTLEHSGNGNQWASVVLTSGDLPFEDETNSSIPLTGYRFVVAADGTMLIEKYSSKGRPVSVVRKQGKPAKSGETVSLGISYAKGRLEFWNFTQRLTVGATVDAPPGYYVSFGAKGVKADFSNVTVTSL